MLVARGLASRRFAAIGPSAGWLSFWSYRARKPPDDRTPIREDPPARDVADRHRRSRSTCAASASTSFTEAKTTTSPSRNRAGWSSGCRPFHRDLVYHGAGRGEDIGGTSPDEPGTDCRRLVAAVRLLRAPRPGSRERRARVEFMTASPGVSSSRDWGLDRGAARAAGDEHSESLRCDPFRRRFVGTTENVARLAIDLAPRVPGESHDRRPRRADDRSDPWPKASPGARRVGFIWREGGRRVDRDLRAVRLAQGPDRYGPFKEAFRNRMVFVYGTKGTRAENDWAFAKARYDAERVLV